MYLYLREMKKITGCNGKPSVGREIWGPDFRPCCGAEQEREVVGAGTER